MNLLVAAIRVAGAIQVLDIAANLALPRRVRWRENLARLSPLVRKIFLVHWFYVLLVLGIFGVACLRFGPELAGGSGLGPFLSGGLAIFWLLRAGIQVFYFDADFRRQDRLGDLTFAFSALFMGVVFAIAARTAAGPLSHPGRWSALGGGILWCALATGAQKGRWSIPEHPSHARG